MLTEGEFILDLLENGISNFYVETLVNFSEIQLLMFRRK